MNSDASILCVCPSMRGQSAMDFCEVPGHKMLSFEDRNQLIKGRSKRLRRHKIAKSGPGANY